MEKLQFRVLYRQFLFRMVDLELLSSSAQGDISRLLGQLAGMLIFFSSVMAFGALIFSGAAMPPRNRLVSIWSTEHFLIETTMLVVGMFAVLSWDSAFPDRRDVLVLSPLPIRPRTMFLAKLAALGAALGLAVVCFNSLAGLAWPLLHFSQGGNPLRTLAAYWISAVAGGVFILGCVLSLQGLAAQFLPRRQFVRLSAVLQLAAFCALLAGYFLEPSLEMPEALVAAQSRPWLEFSPGYWFWGMFHVLNGTSIPSWAALGVGAVWADLARRAWIGFGAAVFGTGTVFLLAYFSTIRKIVESPDIAPGSRLRGAAWMPGFGSAPLTAVVHFSIRTLLRSRQHRLQLVFYLGIGLSFLILLKNAPRPPGQTAPPPEALMLIATLVLMCCWVMGTRIVFSRPLEIRANWVFRVAGTGGAIEASDAARRSLLVLAVAPAWAGSATLLTHWPRQDAMVHLAVLALVGLVVTEVCLFGFRKIPFTCSYLPGASRVHLMNFAGYGVLMVLLQFAQFEAGILSSLPRMAMLVAGLAAAAVGLRIYANSRAKAELERVEFEDTETPAILRLGLNRDGTSV